jgi:DNA topoisomerase IA
MKVVVVESPAKAKTINRYLGDDLRYWHHTAMCATCPAKMGRFCQTMILR